MDDLKREVADLRQAIRDSNISLEALSGALMQFIVHADEQHQALKDEVRAHRRLSKYARRTHFWTMAAMVFGALFLSDLSDHYGHHSMWWGLLFWASQHGSGTASEWLIRAVGFGWQAGWLVFLVRIAQVPDDLWIAAQQVRAERAASGKRFRLF